jgi:hypothetical protein
VTACSFERNSWLFGPSVCEEPATRVLVLGCKREHITENPACDDCAEAVLRQVPKMHCGLCCRESYRTCTHGPGDGELVALIEDRPVHHTPEGAPR